VVRNPDGSAAVWVVEAGNKAEQRQVATEQTVGDTWLIDSGLEPGDRVVVEGLQKLKPGADVVVAGAPVNAAAVAQQF
jgi:membrane fusion protein, multidrug efflux system